MLSPPPTHVVATTLGWVALTWHLLRLAKLNNPGLAPGSLWRTLRLFVGKMRWLRVLRTWYSDTSNPALLEMLSYRPDIVGAVRHPYVNTTWTARRRLRAIQLHYSLLRGPLEVLRFSPQRQVRVTTLAAGDASLDVILDKPKWFLHEGEVAINLFRNGQRLYSLVFLLGRSEGCKAAYVGALQGMGSAQALDVYRELTHALHGLRPRDLLIDAFRVLCRELGVERIFVVSDHSSMNKSGYFDRIETPTSYDSAWLEHRGEPAEEGFFELPTASSRRPPDAIPSRKRAQYRRRYEMLDEFDALIRTGLRRAQRLTSATSAPAWHDSQDARSDALAVDRPGAQG